MKTTDDHAAAASLAHRTTMAGIDALRDGGVVRRFPKGTIIVHEGDPGGSLFLVRSGRCKVYSTGRSDREVVFGIYGPGELLGEMSLDGGPRSASIIAIEPLECTVIGRDALLRHIAGNPDFAIELLVRVIRRARLATESLRGMVLLDVYGRLAGLLESLALPGPDGTRIVQERLTHQEIANRVGASREMISRLMKDLSLGGYIDTSGKRIVLNRTLPTGW